jgi:hypothetical protein
VFMHEVFEHAVFVRTALAPALFTHAMLVR